MSDKARELLMEKIGLNIAQHGHHIYLISGESLPRFAYTIGVSQSSGTELILAGASFYSAEAVGQIVNAVAADIRQHGVRQDTPIAVDSLGVFRLCKVHESWATALMLGALDYYNKEVVSALQIMPDQSLCTIDIPDMARPWSAAAEPIWQWLHAPWDYPFPPTAIATTNIRALRGERATEVVRWESDAWEIFVGSGEDVEKEDMRVVPLATLLAVDKSPDAIANLQIGCGLWRGADDSEWQIWDQR